MTVFAYDLGDPENPLARLSAEDAGRLPYGAAELDADGKILAYNNTEPDAPDGGDTSLVGHDFFDEISRWAGSKVVADEFRKGVSGGNLNVIFDCAVARLPFKVRLHLKVSPILGTYWAFIKRLQRA